MDIFKKIKCIVLTGISVICINNLVFATVTYVDVPKNHWAYESIIRMAEKGYIVGNTKSEYKGNNPIDKFETTKILAMAVGYKYVDVKPNEQELYNKSYEKYKDLLAKYKNKFSRWNSTADREIAYLLEKKILLESDLDHFIILNEKKQEQLRALSRQEAAVFLTKLIGCDYEALNVSYNKNFSDDKNIDKNAKPYVYFLRNKGIISGDDNNNFIPNGAVTREAFAVMLDKTLMESAKSNIKSEKESGVVHVVTIVGNIENLYPSISGIQIKSNLGETKLYRVNSKTEIYIDDVISNYNNLKKDMSIVGVISNNEFINVKAKSNNTEENRNNFEKDSKTNREKEVDNEEKKDEDSNREIKEKNIYNTIQGIVEYISNENNKSYVGIQINMLNPTGGITRQIVKYYIDKNAKISRGDKNIKIEDIIKGDIVKVKASFDKIYEIDIIEKNKQFQGKVLEKKVNLISGENYFIISDLKGNEYEFNITSKSLLERQGNGIVTWNKIKIGDTVDVIAEYGNLIELYAYGNKSIVEGIVEELHIKQNSTYIMIKTTGGSLEKFYVMDKNIDINGLKVGNKVNLKLDSQEIEKIIVLNEESKNYLTVRINSVFEDKIIVNELNNNVKTIYYDKNTEFIDSTIGKNILSNELRQGMLICVCLDNNNTDLRAKIVNVLSR